MDFNSVEEFVKFLDDKYRNTNKRFILVFYPDEVGIKSPDMIITGSISNTENFIKYLKQNKYFINKKECNYYVADSSDNFGLSIAEKSIQHMYNEAISMSDNKDIIYKALETAIKCTIRLESDIKLLEAKNLEQVEKLYIKTKVIPKDVQKMILDTTKGDKYTKPIFDYTATKYQTVLPNWDKQPSNIKWKATIDINRLYNNLSKYDPKILPIQGVSVSDLSNSPALEFESDSESGNLKIDRIFNIRNDIIDTLKDVHPLALKSLEGLSTSRGYNKLIELDDKVSKLKLYIDKLDFENDEDKDRYLTQVFKDSGDVNRWLESIKSRSDIKVFDKNVLKDMMGKLVDTKIIVETKNYTLLNVRESKDMLHLGCRSDWCLGASTALWSHYVHNGNLYLLIDWRYNDHSNGFMTIFVKPFLESDKPSATDMMNNEIESGKVESIWRSFLLELNDRQQSEIIKRVLNWE